MAADLFINGFFTSSGTLTATETQSDIELVNGTIRTDENILSIYDKENDVFIDLINAGSSNSKSITITDANYTFLSDDVEFVFAVATTLAVLITLDTPVGMLDDEREVNAVDTTSGVDVIGTGITQRSISEGATKRFKSNNTIWIEV